MSPDPATPRYRRRHRLPILMVILVLLLGAGFVWVQALKPAPAEATGCNEPGPAPSSTPQTSRSHSTTRSAAGTGAKTAGTASGAATTPAAAGSTTGTAAKTATSGTFAATSVTTSLGTFTDANTLAASRPADPAGIQLRVLNASKVIGQAKTVTDELRAAGFSSILPQENDPLYPASDLHCFGEIRYGPAGLRQARTVLIVAPCAQLVVDTRQDDSVDLALGARFSMPPANDAVKEQLTSIAVAAAPPAVIEGQTAAAKPPPPIPPLPTADCPH